MFMIEKRSGGFQSILLFFILLFPVSCMISTCASDPGTAQLTGHKDISQDSVIRYNQEVVKSEDQEIEDYMARHKLRMEKTLTGLRYMILKHGNGDKAKKGKVATFSYTVRLLNGDKIYSSDEEGLKEFEIGHGGVESGLEEGILLLRVGDKAKIIVPSHLAFGLLGDQKKIPQRATLVYDIELLRLK